MITLSQGQKIVDTLNGSYQVSAYFNFPEIIRASEILVTAWISSDDSRSY